MRTTSPITWFNGCDCTSSDCDHYHYYEPLRIYDAGHEVELIKPITKQKHPPRHFSNSGKGKQRKW